MTRDEAKALFRTAETVFEVADIMCRCFAEFGHDGTEALIEEIRSDGRGIPPYFRKLTK